MCKKTKNLYDKTTWEMVTYDNVWNFKINIQ